MSRYLLIALMLLPTFDISAQILEAPDLACATTNPGNGNVELTWNLPSVSCGPFNSYDIYASNNIGGPYILLASITNSATNTYIHTGANGNTTTWYYYMVSNFNCPGFTPVTSDTLDNLDPVAPPLTFVTVNNGNAEVNWENYISPETYAYIIYIYDGGFKPIDTVYGRNSTSYLNINSNAGSTSELYTIAAMDSCGNTGPFFNDAQRTIYLEYNLANCASEINLTWNDYINWQGGVQSYDVYFSINGGSFMLANSLNGTATSYNFTNFNDGDSVCMYVQANHTNGTYTSESNIICEKISITKGIGYNYMYNASVYKLDSISIEWKADPNSDIESFKILRSKDGSQYNTIATLPPVFPITVDQLFYDTSADPSAFDYFYQVQAVDSCGATITSGTAHTMLLKGRPLPNFNNDLTWNEYEITNGTVEEYNVYRLENNGFTLLATLSPGQTIYTDNIADLHEGDGNWCYRIEAVGTVDFSLGWSQKFYSYSNLKCITQQPLIYTPSAFVPEGINNVFKPVLVFAKMENFEMTIFNRWGQIIYTTTDPAQGWDGRHDGDIVPQGVYGYLIRAQGHNGSTVEDKGTVMVIR